MSSSPRPRFRHVIVDRDGVLNREAPGGYVCTPEEWIWLPGTLEALSRLVRLGIRLSVATNQSCIGRGIIDTQALETIHAKMLREAAAYKVSFSGIYFCPHAPEAGCPCRKPEPGLILSAIRESGIPRTNTLFIGDSARDLQAGQAAGVSTWLVRTGKGEETEKMIQTNAIKGLEPTRIRIFDDLAAACEHIADLQRKASE